MIWYLYILQNDHHNKSIQHPSHHIDTIFFLMMRIFKIYSLSNFQIYISINDSHYATHYIPMTDVFNNWKFVAFDHFDYPLTPDSLSLATTNLFSVIFFLKIPHISVITQYLSFSVWLTSLKSVLIKTKIKPVSCFSSFLTCDYTVRFTENATFPYSLPAKCWCYGEVPSLWHWERDPRLRDNGSQSAC